MELGEERGAKSGTRKLREKRAGHQNIGTAKKKGRGHKVQMSARLFFFFEKKNLIREGDFKIWRCAICVLDSVVASSRSRD
jgi:hypothetical protein